MNAVAIQAENLSCTLGGQAILKGIDLEFADGEFVGIIGPNGAGKSTLVKCLAGLLPSEGSVRIYGKPIREYKRRELARIISYVPQAYFYYFPYTVFEFVLMARYPHVPRAHGFTAADRDQTMGALKLVGIEGLGDRAMAALSGGELQKVFLASALAQGSKIAIMDEPTVFLDPKNHKELLDLLLKLAESENRTLIIVSHDVNFVAQGAESIIGLKDGEIAFTGKPDDLNPGTLREIYSAEFVSIAHPTTKRPIALINPRGRNNST